MKKDSYVRTRSGIIYTLNQLGDDGHCYARRDQLVEAAVKILDVEEPIIQMTLDDMIFRKDVFKETLGTVDSADNENNNQAIVFLISSPCSL